MTTARGDSSHFNVKKPSSLVTTVSPLADILAPAKGSPVVPLSTTPLTIVFCAIARTKARTAPITNIFLSS